MGHRLRKRLVASAVMTACLGAILCGSVAPALAASAPDCGPRVWVIGVRGSGQTPNGSPGGTIEHFIGRLQHIAGKGIVGSEGLRYPAVGLADWKAIASPAFKGAQYLLSVNEGEDNLVKAVRGRIDGCPDQEIVLAGYSQGAHVIRRALPRLKDVADRIGAVVLFGDPGFDPHTWADKRGNYSPRRHGILGVPKVDFPRAYDHVVTYCKDGDLICQGAPNTFEAHSHYVPGETTGAAVRVADWLDLFQAPDCQPAKGVAAIIDDSGSMIDNDPLAIRRSALELLITKPSSQQKELGAIEFGSEARSLFPPTQIASGRASVLAALGGIANDGAADGGESTDYNAAFRSSSASQSGAQARIFLTDGGHNDGAYENLHVGGPPTFVIGLNIGKAGEGSEEADLLGRIATETDGRYFPLVRQPGDSTATQVARLQPTINKIDALLGCQKIQAQQSQSFDSAGQRGAPVRARFRGRKALEVVASWPALETDLDLVSAAAKNKRGVTIADLAGKRKIKGTKRKRAKIAVSRVEGETFETVTVQRPEGADSIVVRFTADVLPAPVEASVQVRSVPPGAPPVTVPPASQPSSPPPPNSPPPPLRRVLTVDNRVTNGAGMREDSTPVRLTTQPWTHCGSRGCNINGTERGSGGTYDAATCQTVGERTTNGNDHDASDDSNPERFESSRYYGVTLTNGTFGYVSEVWIRAADRGGLGLPAC